MISKEQCRAARGLLGWTAKQLAEEANVGVMTISRFESGQGETYPATRSVIQASLEARGVMFIPSNGEGAGVRLRKDRRPITQEGFLGELQRYEKLRLPSKAIHDRGQPPIFPGYRFVYTSPDSVDLMVEDKVLGRAAWHDGAVVFEPALTLPLKERSFEDDVDEWLSLAQLRRTIGAR